MRRFNQPIRTFVQALLLGASTLAVAAPDLNGTWMLDAQASQNFEDAGRELNRELNARERRGKKQTFARDAAHRQASNKYDEQRLATEQLIREDARAQDWDVPDNVRALVDAQSIKLYRGRKVALLYDAEVRRLLTVNPAGRAYSVSGTQMTEDERGRTLTYFDGDAIVIETDLVSGDRLVERFEPGGEPGRMKLTTRLQRSGRGPWLEFARVFDRVE